MQQKISNVLGKVEGEKDNRATCKYLINIIWSVQEVSLILTKKEDQNKLKIYAEHLHHLIFSFNKLRLSAYDK